MSNYFFIALLIVIGVVFTASIIVIIFRSGAGLPVNVDKPYSPFDHDGDGKVGGSRTFEARGLDDLRAEAKALGIRIDHRWGAARLRQEIEARYCLSRTQGAS